MKNPLETPRGQVVVATSMLLGAAAIFWWAGVAEDTAVQEVDDLRVQLEDSVESQGGRVFPLSTVETGRLSQGAVSEYEVPLEGVTRAYVIAGCDEDCTDLDVSVIDPSGNPVVTDEEPDARPVAIFRPERDGTYRALVSMAACHRGPCAIAYQVLEATGAIGGYGTCFAVSPDGKLMTAWHVVNAAREIRVNFADGITHEAYVVTKSEANDLAVLSIVRKTPEWLSFAESGVPQIGQKIFTIGFPAPEALGKEPKFTEGSVSALTGMLDEENSLQVSIPIQPGNSGGPVVTERGQVIGVIASSATEDATGGVVPQNVNYAIKGAIAAGLLGDMTRLKPAASLEKAIARARDATCMVTTVD